jgi:hypothetical protein
MFLATAPEGQSRLLRALVSISERALWLLFLLQNALGICIMMRRNMHKNRRVARWFPNFPPETQKILLGGETQLQYCALLLHRNLQW